MLKHTITDSNGRILTGKLWRLDHPDFKNLPFYTNVARMDEMSVPIDGASTNGGGRDFEVLLVKFAKGLDAVHPFSDTSGVDHVLRDAKHIFLQDKEDVGPKNAARIWGFISKFVMVDRFAKTLFGTDFHAGVCVPRTLQSEVYLGTGVKILEDLAPPTKILRKFLRIWGDRQKTTSQTISTPPSVKGHDRADVMLTISRRLIDVGEVKSAINIESGLEMIALALAISSENNGVFPELATDVKPILWRIWSDRMEQPQLEKISNEIQSLHKSMRNIIEMVFATSPLLALSNRGWSWKTVNSTYLLRVSCNNRPQILIDLEDRVLECIMAISEGQSAVNALDTLYSQISLLEKDLSSDDDALNWFNLSKRTGTPTLPTPPASAYPFTPSADNSQGLATPPESSINARIVTDRSSKNLYIGKVSPIRYVNPKDVFSSESFGDEPRSDLTEQEVDGFGGDDAASTSRPRKSSVQSSSTKSATSSTSATSGNEPDHSHFVEEPELDSSGDESMEDIPVESNDLLMGKTVDEDGGLSDVVKLMESSSGLGESWDSDQTMAGVESNKPSSSLIRNEEDGGSENSDSTKSISGSEEVEDQPAGGVESSEPLSGLMGKEENGERDNDDPMESPSGAGEEGDEGHHPKVGLVLDTMEVDGEDRPAIEVNSNPSDPLEDLSKASTIKGIEGAKPMIGVESNQKSLHSNGSDNRRLPLPPHVMRLIHAKKAMTRRIDPDVMEVDGEGRPAIEVDLKNSSDPLEDLCEASTIKGIEAVKPMIRVESIANQAPLHSDGSDNRRLPKSPPVLALIQVQKKWRKGRIDPDFLGSRDDVDNYASDELVRRSTRNVDAKNKGTTIKYVSRPPTQKSSRSKRKMVPKKDRIFLQDDYDSEDEMPKLCNVGKSEYHPTIQVDIVGWGSTVEAGAKPFCHVPVKIIPPANVESTGEDAETLRMVEGRIQAEFKNGLPPHLQPNAKSISYLPGSDQSRIFVASHSEFTRLHAGDVQRILRERVILVHGNTSDYSYGWNLESFGRLYDVDKKTTVHVANLFDPVNTGLRHHHGTLREFHEITTTSLNEDYPPLNAIALSSYARNLNIPCQFGSMASHEVAQSRLHSDYVKAFKAHDVKEQMEWSLIGSRGIISPFHVDSDGLGTVVVVLEGSKYWVLATRLGDEDTISSVGSLGPGWNPYFFNKGENADRFRFEGVHLQKGDMLIMPGGVPHWVLGTSNSICVGRHFYGASTVRLSVITIVHTFLKTGAVTNADLVETRTLLYQLMVFWSIRLDKRDVDGAHIPDISSEVEFFDVLYLGIFIILSPAFDRRFYLTKNPPVNVVAEVGHAIGHFCRLLHIFSMRFIIVLEGGVVVAHSYVVDRLLAEFAAAAVNLSRAIDESNRKKDGVDDDEGGDSVEDSQTSMLTEKIEGILKESHPEIFSYYCSVLDNQHKHFTWTGPKLKILPRSRDVLSIIPLITLGERMDLPWHKVYSAKLDVEPPLSTNILPLPVKRHDPADPSNPSDDMPKKRQRLL